MPYTKHPDFLPPNDPNSKIWRYMDLAKFLSILENRCLYFVRLDQLANVDPFEGYYTNLNVKIDNIPFENMPKEWKEKNGVDTKELYEAIIQANKDSREFVKYNREVTFVNSWHIKEYESAAMWNLYLSNHEGVCIRSTYNKFIKSLEAYDDFEIHIGKIKYIDYQSEAIPMGNIFSPFIYKRKSFEHEEELRALIWTPQYGKNNISDRELNRYKNNMGLYVPVNVEELVEKIFVCPSAPKWIADLIRSLVKKYELTIEVIQSDLAAKPLY